MTKHFRSEYAFQKHKPHLSWRKKISRLFHKKQYTIQLPRDSFDYKTNPFKIEKKKPKRGIKIKLLILLTLLLIWGIFLAYIPYFKINKIYYQGIKNITQTELDEFIGQNYLDKRSLLPTNNYFIVNTKKIATDLYKEFALETVQVTKLFPNQLNINIEEKISSVIYDNGKKYFLLDSGGTAIKYLKDVEPHEIIQKIVSSSIDILAIPDATSTPAGASSTAEHIPDYKQLNKLFGNYPIIYDRRGIEVDIKQENILPPRHIAAAIDWHNTLAEQGIASPKFFILDNLNSGMVIDTTAAWDIMFQPEENSATQINSLKEILSAIKPQQYVDLRFGNKVYWK